MVVIPDEGIDAKSTAHMGLSLYYGGAFMGHFGCIHRHHDYALVVLVYANATTSTTVIIYIYVFNNIPNLRRFGVFLILKPRTQFFLDPNVGRGAN